MHRVMHNTIIYGTMCLMVHSDMTAKVVTNCSLLTFQAHSSQTKLFLLCKPEGIIINSFEFDCEDLRTRKVKCVDSNLRAGEVTKFSQ